MATISVRLPSSILARVCALREKHGWSLREILEQSIDFAYDQTAEFSKYLSSYNTHSGKRRGKRRTVINTSISDKHDRTLRRLPSDDKTVSEALNAAVRQFLDSLLYRPSDPERIFDATPLEMFFPVKSFMVEKYQKRESLASIPPNSSVVVDARIFLYAYVSVSDTESSRWIFQKSGISRECHQLIRRIRDGDLTGYTTVGELGRLYDLLPYSEVEKDKRRFFIASILKSGFHLLTEDSATILRAIGLKDFYQDSLFLAAASFLHCDHLYIATASNSTSKRNSEISIRTPLDLSSESIYTAP